MTVISLWITVSAVLALDLTLIVTLLSSSVQIWPPPGRDTWQYWLTWILFDVSALSFLVLGGLDQGSLGLSQQVGDAATTIGGSLLFATGISVASYAMGYIGHRAALGLESELVTGGPYAYSRNPGYVGDLMMIAGYVILTDSLLAGVVAGLASIWFLLAPLAEEPWLEAQYGDAYRRYRADHPRWLV